MTARRCCAAVWLALIVIGLAGSSWASGPPKIRVGWVAAPAHLLPVILTRPALLKHYGKTYTVEPVHFHGSTPQITALAAGELDIAMLAYSSFALAILNARMADFTHQPRAGLATWLFTKKDNYDDLDARPNLDGMQKNLDVMRKLGLLKIHLDVKAYSDLSLIDEAAARLSKTGTDHR